MPPGNVTRARPLGRIGLVVGLLLVVNVVGAATVAGQTNAGAVPGTAAAPGATSPTMNPGPAPETLVPPTLTVHPEAVFPAQALRQRLEGNVGLQLDVDAAGRVLGVRVVSPAG
ncbi:MAG TPA: energy transducer TonB, partial [Polyangia bacterium]|nr:energy transducer TonB [Polyangia bacterium]